MFVQFAWLIPVWVFWRSEKPELNKRRKEWIKVWNLICRNKQIENWNKFIPQQEEKLNLIKFSELPPKQAKI